MGNYNGSVRCSHCYETGHNKRTCPDYTETLLRRLEQYRQAAIENPDIADGYMVSVERIAAQIGKRTGTNPLSGEKITKRGPTRKCSYCKYKHGSWTDAGLGHTRRTCPELKEDYSDAVTVNAAYRAGILENMRKIGLGTGALISQVVGGHFKDADGTEVWDRRPVVTMVQQINWDDVCYTSSYEQYVYTQRMDMFGQRAGIATLGPARIFDEENNMLRFSSNNGGVWSHTEGTRIGQWGTSAVEEARYAGEPATALGTRMLAMVPRETITPPEGWESGDCELLRAHFAGLKG
jgi:hypothetical protein